MSLQAITLAHPFKGLGGGYEFAVPMLGGDHVTDDAGTGFVHTAPGHGREDFRCLDGCAHATSKRAAFLPAIPFTVDDAGYYTKDAPGFGPDREGGAARVIDDNGKKGDANKARYRRTHQPRQRLVCTWSSEAFLSAFVALEESR